MLSGFAGVIAVFIWAIVTSLYVYKKLNFCTETIFKKNIY